MKSHTVRTSSVSSSHPSLRRAGAGTLLLALLAAGILASSAWAGANTFMSYQSLGAGNAYASSTVAPGIFSSAASTNHTACAGIGNGYAGYTSTPFTGGHNTYYGGCHVNYPIWCYYSDCRETGPASYQRGIVYNPNGTTTDYVYSASMYWN